MADTTEKLEHVQSSVSTLMITEKMDEKLDGVVIHREIRTGGIVWVELV